MVKSCFCYVYQPAGRNEGQGDCLRQHTTATCKSETIFPSLCWAQQLQVKILREENHTKMSIFTLDKQSRPWRTWQMTTAKNLMQKEWKLLVRLDINSGNCKHHYPTRDNLHDVIGSGIPLSPKLLVIWVLVFLPSSKNSKLAGRRNHWRVWNPHQQQPLLTPALPRPLWQPHYWCMPALLSY